MAQTGKWRFEFSGMCCVIGSVVCGVSTDCCAFVFGDKQTKKSSFVAKQKCL
jgi:hypothetical protein